jgi:hypothetical protein
MMSRRRPSLARSVLWVIAIGMVAMAPQAWADNAASSAATQQVIASDDARPAADVVEPALPANLRWAKELGMGIAALFVAALVVGGFVRRELPEEVPPSHSHDEPPGSSGRHGISGTIDRNDPTAPRAPPDE